MDFPSFSLRAELDPASARYVPRSAYMEKRGSAADGTDAAHKMSWELYNGMGMHMSGRPASDHEAIGLAMGSADNLRIKSAYGNRVLDARRDERIVHAFAYGGGELHEKTTAMRAYQAYEGGMSGDATMRSRADAIGEMTFHSGGRGRPIKIKNMHKYK